VIITIGFYIYLSSEELKARTNHIRNYWALTDLFICWTQPLSKNI